MLWSAGGCDGGHLAGIHPAGSSRANAILCRSMPQALDRDLALTIDPRACISEPEGKYYNAPD